MNFTVTETNANVVRPSEASWNGGPETSRVLPFEIPAADVYLWSPGWQAGERESLRSLDAGEFVDFNGDDPDDAARWLRKSEDE